MLWPWAPAEGRPDFVPGVLDLEYEITAGELLVARTRFSLTLGADRFGLAMTIEPGGLPSLFSSFKLKSRADGLKAGALIEPQSYRSVYWKRDKRHRSVEIDYDGEEIGTVLADPSPKEDKRPTVPESLINGSLDPLTGAFALLQAVAESGRCQGVREVHDGRRLFRVEVQEPAIVRQVSGRPSGPASGLFCRVLLSRLAGFRDKEIRERRFPEVLLAELAPVVPGAPWLPVRLTVQVPEAAFGSKVANLVSAKWRER
jgi:hypothetical protein